MKKPLLLICCLILFFITGCETRESVECIAPANAGGGWDLTCRALGSVVADAQLIEERIRVLNMPGAGGGVAYAHVVTERGEGEQGRDQLVVHERFSSLGTPEDVSGRALGSRNSRVVVPVRDDLSVTHS